MDLEFSAEQNLLRETVRGLCARYASSEVIRKLEDDPIGYPTDLWHQFGELGLVGLRLPERYGGSEQGMLEAAILYEECGRALAPTPHFGSAVMSGGVLLRAGSEAQKDEWLAKIASGEALLAPAWLEPQGSFDAAGVGLEAKAVDGGFALSGVKSHVAFAAAAQRLVVLARTGDDIDLFLVDPNASGVELTQRKTMASDAQFEVRFDAVRVPQEDRIGPARSGWSTWTDVLYEGVILLAAQAIGGAERALEMTVAYAKERHQFGKPLGAFQALAHDMADAVTAIDGGRTLVHEAAWACDSGRSIKRLAPMAKSFACRTFRDTTKTAQQIHGGMGFSVEYDIQLYFRRAKQLQVSWWDTSYCEELIAADVLDGDGPPDLRSAPG